MYGQQNHDYPVEVEELVSCVVPDYQVPESTEQGSRLFVEIIDKIKDLGY